MGRGLFAIKMRGILYRGWFPYTYTVPSLAEDGTPFKVWDKSTYFNNLPSAKSSSKITVIGDQSLYCLKLTWAQALEYVWRIKKLKVECSLNTPPGITVNPQGTTPSSITAYGTPSESPKIADLTQGSSTFLEQADLPQGNYPSNLGLRYGFDNPTDVYNETPSNGGSSSANVQVGSLAINHLFAKNRLVMVGPNEFWLNPIDLYYSTTVNGYGHSAIQTGTYQTNDPFRRWKKGDPIYANYVGYRYYIHRIQTYPDTTSPERGDGLVPCSIKLKYSDGSFSTGNPFALVFSAYNGQEQDTISYTSIAPSGLTITLTPTEWFSYGGVWNTTTGLLTGA